MAFEEERALVRKEQREARQVYLSRVHFRLREVGVHRRRADDVRADPLTHVQARLNVSLHSCARRRHTTSARHGRPNREAATEVEVGQSGEQSGAARLSHLVLAVWKGPAITIACRSARTWTRV